MTRCACCHTVIGDWDEHDGGLDDLGRQLWVCAACCTACPSDAEPVSAAPLTSRGSRRRFQVGRPAPVDSRLRGTPDGFPRLSNLRRQKGSVMDEFLHQRRLDRTLVSVDAVGDHIELQLWTDGSASTERPRLVLLTGLVHIAVDVNVDQLIALCGELERLVDELLERRRAAHVNAESAGLAEVE